MYYNGKSSPLDFLVRSDSTYDVYINEPDQKIQRTWIYHTKPCDINSMDGAYLNKIVIGTVFFYTDEKNYPDEFIFFNKKTKEVYQVYPYFDTIYPEQADIMATTESHNLVNPIPRYIILSPIFKSQPKVWIIIQRNFKTSFPGVIEADSNFLPNGDLHLVITSQYDPRYYNTLMADKTETIHIDYAVFQKSVHKPTCYALPEDHKLRLCTEAEAKIRSLALTVFLNS